MVEDIQKRLDEVNKSAYKILRDLKHYWDKGNASHSEICYWQLHGMLYALDLLGLYDPLQHRPIERQCESFLMALYDKILSEECKS